MSTFLSAPRDRWLPDGTQSGAGPTSPHDEAVRRIGANVVTDSGYRSPQTAYGPGTLPGSHVASTPAWQDPRSGHSLSSGHLAYGTPPQMHGYQTSSFAQPQSFLPSPQTSLWQTTGRAPNDESYIPFDDYAACDVNRHT